MFSISKWQILQRNLLLIALLVSSGDLSSTEEMVRSNVDTYARNLENYFGACSS